MEANSSELLWVAVKRSSCNDYTAFDMRSFLLAILVLSLGMPVFAQQVHHDHGAQPSQPVSRPRVFLDKSPRIIWYQLNRLSNERLLVVERTADDRKFVPVWEAILLRPGISKQDKLQAVTALVGLQSSDAVAVLLDAVGRLTGSARQQDRAARQLTSLLLEQPDAPLVRKHEALGEAAAAGGRWLQRTAFAALLKSGKRDVAWARAQSSESATIAYLAAIPLLSDRSLRSALRSRVTQSLDTERSAGVRRAAVRALADIPAKYADTFRIVASLVREPDLEATAVRTLLKIPQPHRTAETGAPLARWLVEKAEQTPARDRTSDTFLDAMQLADQLLAVLPVERARSYRERLRAVTVRVVRIHTVEEEMRYDIRFFAVEAGRPVQIVLQNEDLMPHNLVVTTPGSMREVAELGAALPPDQGHQGRQYVPATDSVLYATHMVQAGKQERLTFTAPLEPGEYPFVCTFPRHWMRMYGVMVVVQDLDAWLQDPQEPADPLGNNRSVVKKWSLDDFPQQLTAAVQHRNPPIGERLFVEATCAQCHKIRGQGGAVGPELTDVVRRWKGDHANVLREILDPSYKVDPKFAVQIIFTEDGRVISGVVTEETKDSVTIVSNPESPRPAEIARDDIAEIQKTSTSLMPKGLLDRFSQDEIFEILGYLEWAAVDGSVER